jgi:hypothetical protein
MSKEDLGDAVMVEFDGYGLWLTTDDGNNQRIYLEPEVYHALTRYVERLKVPTGEGAP